MAIAAAPAVVTPPVAARPRRQNWTERREAQRAETEAWTRVQELMDRTRLAVTAELPHLVLANASEVHALSVRRLRQLAEAAS